MSDDHLAGWSRRDFLRRTGLALGLGGAALEAFLVACGNGNAGGPTGGNRVEGGELVIAFPNTETNDAKGLDPNIGGGATYTNSMYSAMFDQLVYQDPKTGKVVPGLAERWDVTADGMLYTFHLSPKAKWWDGTDVTADDVKFTLDRATNPNDLQHTAYNRGLAAQYNHAEAVDAKTVKVYLNGPQANFLQSAVGRTYFSIVPKAYVEKVGLDAFNQKPMGSGAFQLVDWAHGDRITVKKNPAHTWGPAFFQTNGRPPSVDKIVFRFIQDDSTRLAALQSGAVNAIIGIAPFDQATVTSSGQYQIVPVRKNGQAGGLNLHTQRFPTSDLAVRQAIAYAVDRDAINKAVWAGTDFPSYHLLEDRMAPWVDPKAALPNTDLGKAKSVLDEAGWAPGSDGVRSKGGQRLVVKAICGPDTQQAMTLIQSQLKPVGIQFDVQILSSAQVSNIVTDANGAYNAAWVIKQGWTNEDPRLLYNLFSSNTIPPKGTSNYSRVALPDVDQLLQTANSTLDATKRQDLYYQAQQKLVAYVPFVPLISINQNIATVKGVNGLMPDIRGTYTYFNDVWIDKSIQSKWSG